MELEHTNKPHVLAGGGLMNFYAASATYFQATDFKLWP